MLSRVPLIAAALFLISLPLHAESRVQVPHSTPVGRAEAAFECHALARRINLDDEAHRLARHGVEQWTNHYEALEAGGRDELERGLGVFNMYFEDLTGPDFHVGRVMTNSDDRIQRNLVSTLRSLGTDGSIWAEEYYKLAHQRFEDRNCAHLGL